MQFVLERLIKDWILIVRKKSAFYVLCKLFFGTDSASNRKKLNPCRIKHLNGNRFAHGLLIIEVSIRLDDGFDTRV